MAPRFANPTAPAERRCSPDMDGLGDGRDHHRDRPFNPALTLTFYRLRKVALRDTVFYCAAQLLGAMAGVALASLVLEGAPAHKAVRYAATIPGIHGEAFYVNTIAFVAELVISCILMARSCSHPITKSWRLIRITLPPSWLRYTSLSNLPCPV
jgi:Major intrinsic protein